MEILTAIAKLKHQSISFLIKGEITTQDHDLVFFLDHQEVQRFSVPGLKGITAPISFNHLGIANGGIITLQFNRTYYIIVEDFSGQIRVE